MFEFGLRIVVLLMCSGIVLTAFQVAWWTITPWMNSARVQFDDDFTPRQTVTISPVDMIEGGKIKSIEGKSIAKQLSHQIDEIKNILTRDLQDDYKTLADKGISIPDTTVQGGQVFAAQSNDRIEFQAELFSFDVAGLLNFVHGTLEKRDSVSTMIEIGAEQSRLFVEVSSGSRAKQRFMEQGGANLASALDKAACAVAVAYLGQGREFVKMSPGEFCAYSGALDSVQKFIAFNAARVRSDKSFDKASVRAVAEPFESAPLADSGAAIVDLILAGLYRLEDQNDKALARLELAARIVPGHSFVTANLERWRQEKESRDTAQALIRSNERTETGVDRLRGVFETIQNQAALRAINYDKMLAKLKGLDELNEVTIAVLDTGYTPPGILSAPMILEGQSFVPEESVEDGQGHGNKSTNLMVAMLPFDAVKIQPIKVLSNSGAGQESWILDGLELAISQRSEIICANFGYGGEKGEVHPAYTHLGAVAEEANSFFLAVAGNGSQRDRSVVAAVVAPANSPAIIAVGGANGDRWASFSPGPEGVDLVAPAVDITTTLNGVKTTKFSGTTPANAIACAIAAAARMVDPGLTRTAFLDLAAKSATQVGNGPNVINADALLERVIAQSRR